MSPVVASLSPAGDNTFSQVFFHSVRVHHMTPFVFSLPTSIFPPASPISSLVLIFRHSSPTINLSQLIQLTCTYTCLSGIPF